MWKLIHTVIKFQEVAELVSFYFQPKNWKNHFRFSFLGLSRVHDGMHEHIRQTLGWYKGSFVPRRLSMLSLHFSFYKNCLCLSVILFVYAGIMVVNHELQVYTNINALLLYYFMQMSYGCQWLVTVISFSPHMFHILWLHYFTIIQNNAIASYFTKHFI